MSEKNATDASGARDWLTIPVIGSYVLFVVGLVVTACSAKYLPEPWKTVGITIGSTLIAAGVLSIFFEHFGRKLLMQEFTAKVQPVLHKELKDFLAKSEHLKRSGIDDFGVIPPRKEIEEMLAGAKKSIIISKTWIPREDSPHLREGLERALARSKENSGPEVKILCLDPASPLVGQRFLDSHPKTPQRDAAKEGQQRIIDGLREIMDYCRDEQRYRYVQIRTYRNVPAVSLYSTENMAWIGWYWLGTEALGGPALLVSGKGEDNLGNAARANFERIWAQSSEYAPEVEDTAFSDAAAHVAPPPDTLLKQLASPLSPDELRPMLADWPGIQEYGRSLVTKLREEGYCIVRNFPFSADDEQDARRNQFLLLACACGVPTDHKPPDLEYVCEVTPRPDRDRQVETYSEHDREARLHTDSHYNDAPESFVAFLMEEQAEYGGRNILLRFSTLKREMQSTIEGRKWFEYFKSHDLPSAKPSRYSKQPTEEPEIKDRPIIVENGTAIRFREDTIRKAIELLSEQNKPRNKRQDEEQEKGLDFLTRLIYRSPYRRGVTLSKGQMLFLNNHTVLHARTGFEGLPRLLLRIRFNA
ncbi:MAG: TauD/TfdA family dioxygenase [Candidatus Sulfotelmatobacter sp.]